MAAGGVVNPVYAAAGFGGFKPRGTDTVPAMLTPGEVVLTKENVAELRKDSKRSFNEGEETEGRGGTVINNVFNISAIDQKGVANFFKKNRKQISNSQRQSRRENNPIRRGGN